MVFNTSTMGHQCRRGASTPSSPGHAQDPEALTTDQASSRGSTVGSAHPVTPSLPVCPAPACGHHGDVAGALLRGRCAIAYAAGRSFPQASAAVGLPTLLCHRISTSACKKVAQLIPWRRQISAVVMPASWPFKIARICSSLNLLRFIGTRFLGFRLYQKAVTFQEGTSARLMRPLGLSVQGC